MAHGRMKWFPAVLLDEIKDLKNEEDITKDTEAITKLVKYARVGRETKRIIKFDFSHKTILPSVDSYSKRGRPKRKGWL